jgi:hypothetical protein
MCFTYKRIAGIFLLIIVNVFTVRAQFTVSGDFKFRPEYRGGYGALRDSSKTPYLILQGRARIIFDYKYEKFTTRISLHDAFIFGQNNLGSDTITKNTINIYEVWVKYNLSKYFAVQAGRVEISYDDQRFLSNNNWAMPGTSHDLVMIQWQVPGMSHRGDFAFAINNTAPATTYLVSYDVKNSYKYMSYAWLEKKFLNDNLKLSVLALADAFQKTSLTSTVNTITHDTIPVYNGNDSIIGTTVITSKSQKSVTTKYPDILYTRVTAGLNAWYTLKKWEFYLGGFYQGGHIADGRKLNAYLFGGSVGFKPLKALKLVIAYDYLSGTDYSDTTGVKKEVNGFSCLYGSGHIFTGYMDIFGPVAKNNQSVGLGNFSARVFVYFSQKISADVKYHWMSATQDYEPVTVKKKGDLPYVKVDKTLGHEFDFTFNYKPFPAMEILAGYSFFLPTETMEIQSGLTPGTSKFAQYAYVQLQFRPQFFSSEKK